MSYRGTGGGFSSDFRRGRDLPQNGAQNRRPFEASRNMSSDLDDKDHMRLPDINRERKQVHRREGKLKSRIPLPARNKQTQGNELNSREPQEGTGNNRTPNLNFPHYLNSDRPAGRDQRKARVNAVKRVKFYRNGDRHFRGVEMVVTRQRYRSFDTIVEDLSKAIPLPYGVRNVFSPGGSEITSLDQLEDGRHYICSSGDHLVKNVTYGEKQNRKPRSLGSESSTSSLVSSSSSHDSRFSGINGNSKPRVIIVVSERDKNKKCKVILNRKTIKSYEDVLKDISDMLKYPVKELRTLQGDKVKGLSQLLRDQDTFLATSMEQGFKRNLSNPSSLSSGEPKSASPFRKRHVPKSRKKHKQNSSITSQTVSIRVKGREHIYHHTAGLDNYTISDLPVSPPAAKLQLSWVYGYYGKDNYKNLHVLPSGEILYFVSTIVVIYNKTANSQRHYTGHADDIKCMAVHPNQWYIATGQVSGLSVDQNELGHIRIWDAETLITLAVLALQEYSLSVFCLGFSQEDNGKQLACVDSLDDEFHLTVWDWEERTITQQSKGMSSAVLALSFDPDDSHTLVSCGKEHIHFWRLLNTRLERKSGYFEKYETPEFFTCIEFSPNGDVITGDSNGSIMVWGKVSKKIKFVVRNAHEKIIMCLRLLENGTLLTGGLDGKISAWDANKYFNTPLQEIHLDTGLGGVSAIEPLRIGHGDNISAVVGLTSNSIVQGSFDSSFLPVVQSHKGDVHALAVHPHLAQFISGSLDCSVSVWDAETHQVIWTVEVEFPVTSANYYSTGDVVALGTSVGRWIVLSCETGMHIASFQDGVAPLPDLEYAKDGEHIAIASHDGNIYVHAVYDEGSTYRRVGCCSGHSEPIMFLDWSLDGCFLQSLSTDYEHIVWEIGGFQREEKQDIIRDIGWSTRNVMLGFDVAGAWPSQPDDGNLINSSDLSWSREVFAVGDELGYIRLFRFPCSQPGAHFHQWRGHSCPVTRMLFLASDTHLITTGSRDFCILQWLVEGNLPALKEEDEYEMGMGGLRVGRHQNSQGVSDDDSYSSDYSNDGHVEENYGDDMTKGRPERAWQNVSENKRYSGDANLTEHSSGHIKPNRKTYLGDDHKVTERSPQRNALPKNRSKQGSYAERFNKQKVLHPQQEPEDVKEYSDDDDDRGRDSYRQVGRGRGQGIDRISFPSREPDRRRDRRFMK